MRTDENYVFNRFINMRNNENMILTIDELQKKLTDYINFVQDFGNKEENEILQSWFNPFRAEQFCQSVQKAAYENFGD